MKYILRYREFGKTCKVTISTKDLYRAENLAKDYMTRNGIPYAWLVTSSGNCLSLKG